MNIDLRKPTLVLTGAWNPAIFQLGWIAKFLFEIPEEKQIRANSVLTGTGPTDAKEIVYIDNIGLSVSSGRVEIYVNSLSEDDFGQAEQLVSRIVDVLPHTPVNALGVNFNFSEPEPSDDLQDKLTTKDDIHKKFKILGQELRVSLDIFEGCTLNLNRVMLNVEAVLDFNYHFENIVSQGVTKTADHVIKRCFDDAQQIMSGVYNLDEQIKPIAHQFIVPKEEKADAN